jgi:hypothetical protein
MRDVTPALAIEAQKIVRHCAMPEDPGATWESVRSDQLQAIKELGRQQKVPTLTVEAICRRQWEVNHAVSVRATEFAQRACRSSREGYEWDLVTAAKWMVGFSLLATACYHGTRWWNTPAAVVNTHVARHLDVYSRLIQAMERDGCWKATGIKAMCAPAVMTARHVCDETQQAVDWFARAMVNGVRARRVADPT